MYESLPKLGFTSVELESSGQTHVKPDSQSLRSVVGLCVRQSAAVTKGHFTGSFLPRPLLSCPSHPNGESYVLENAHVLLQFLINHQPLWPPCLLVVLKGNNWLQTRFIYGLGPTLHHPFCGCSGYERDRLQQATFYYIYCWQRLMTWKD